MAEAGTVVGPATRGGGAALAVLVALALGALAISRSGVTSAWLAGSALLFALAAGVLALRGRARSMRGLRGRLPAIAAVDPSPIFMTDTDGRVLARNQAAAALLDGREAPTIGRALGVVLPNPTSVTRRLTERLARQPAAREDVITRRGRMRVTALAHGDGRRLWRIETMAGEEGGGADELSLPALTASRQGVVLHVNTALRRLFGGRPRRLEDMFSEVPAAGGGIQQVMTESGPRLARVVTIAGPGGRQEIHIVPAQGEDAGLRLESLPVPLLRVSPSGRVLQANGAARRLLDLQPEEAPRLDALVSDLGVGVQAWLADAVAGRATPEIAATTRVPGRSVRITPVAAGGVEGGLYLLFEECSGRGEAESQFLQSQKMHAVGRLAGAIAHDFNNLVAAIAGHAELALARQEPDSQDHEDLAAILETSRRAADLVAQLLAFSRRRPVALERLDVGDTVAGMTTLLERLLGPRHELVLDLGPELPRVLADRRHLEQIVMNLVVNARDAMPEGGAVRITLQRATIDAPLLRDGAEVSAGTWLRLTVEDRGGGIPEEIRDRIFEPFFTTRPGGEGTGLGLSTVYGLVKQAGGYVFAENLPDGGARFEILLPAAVAPADRVPALLDPARAPEPEAAAPVRSGEADGRIAPLSILVVEDEDPVRAFVTRALRLDGHHVEEAGSLAEAAEVLAALPSPPQLVLCDVLLPDGNGAEWVEGGGLPAEIPVVLMSGYPDPAHAERQHGSPIRYLEKPFSRAALARVVGEVAVPIRPGASVAAPDG